jgi:vacuolar-type H+-ATPase subunit I/STV1
MTIGLGIILLVLGLILLTGAVDLPDAIANAIATEPLGWILTIAGVLAIAIGVLLSVNRSQHTTAVEHRRYDVGPYPGEPQGPGQPPQGNYPPQQGNYPPDQGPSQGGYPGGRA